MVMPPDRQELIEELLLGCGPALPGETVAVHSNGAVSSLGLDRLLIGMTVLRGLDRETLEGVAAWLLGATSTFIRDRAGNEPDAYRNLVKSIGGSADA